MAFFRKKSDEELRMHFAAPSFFLPVGSEETADSPREARRICEENAPCAVVFIPSLSVFSSPRSWAGALSSASYLIVVGDKKLRAFSSFMTIIDGIVFSPVPRRLSSAFIAESRDEVLSLLSGVKETFPHIITLRASDGDVAASR